MPKHTFADNLTERQRRTFANRLAKLRGLLLDLKPEAYNHGTWLSPKGHHASAASAIKECGTVACALGHAVARRSTDFRSLPLHFASNGYFDFRLNPDEPGCTQEQAADSYFGPGVYEAVFEGDAVPHRRAKGKSAVKTTVKNIERFMEQRLGYVPA